MIDTDIAIILTEEQIQELIKEGRIILSGWNSDIKTVVTISKSN